MFLWGRQLIMLCGVVLCAGCVTAPPKKMDNVCDIFREKDDWYDDVTDAAERWDIPSSVIMAIMHQESRFDGAARPPRSKILWIFPGPRLSSAYGYAQAKDETWYDYQNNTGQGGADRDDFEDAADFIGWYASQARRCCGIPSSDAYRLYLAYHEGMGGYKRKSYVKKPWLVKVAKKVQRRASRYQQQLSQCKDEFEGWSLWPF